MIIRLLVLFFNFLKLGLFSIGGGYAIMPLIQQLVVSEKGWLSVQEFTDIITISQMTPGPLAVNTATFVGMRLEGVLGALVATLGTIIGGVIISIALYKFFLKYRNIDSIANVLEGLKASSVGLITAAAASILLISFFGSQSLNIDMSKLNIVAVIIFISSLVILRKYKINPILMITISGVVGLIVY